MRKMSVSTRSFAALTAAVALILTACGGGGSDSGQAQEFCDQLAAGTAPFDIFQSMRDDYPDQPAWAAAAKDWAKSTCPDQLASNEQLRNIISNTGGDPDS
jgi:ABC-type glycerol-3-phosphate transport system substrate-binding protein